MASAVLLSTAGTNTSLPLLAVRPEPLIRWYPTLLGAVARVVNGSLPVVALVKAY